MHVYDGESDTNNIVDIFYAFEVVMGNKSNTFVV